MLLLGSCASSYSGFKTSNGRVCRASAWQVSGTATKGQKHYASGRGIKPTKSLGKVKKGKGRTHKASH